MSYFSLIFDKAHSTNSPHCSPFWQEQPFVCSIWSTAYLHPKMTNFDEVDFSECCKEEIFFLTISVCRFKNLILICCWSNLAYRTVIATWVSTYCCFLWSISRFKVFVFWFTQPVQSRKVFFCWGRGGGGGGIIGWKTSVMYLKLKPQKSLKISQPKR